MRATSSHRNRWLAALMICLLGLGTACSQKETRDSDAAEPAQLDLASLPSLRAQLDSLKAASAERIPAEMITLMQNGVQQVARSEVMNSALKVGDIAPTFGLTGSTGRKVHLPALLKRGPVVLMFYRGGWCPYCNLQLAAMQDVLPEIERLGATLLAIGPEIPDSAVATATGKELQYEVLSDVGNRIAHSYGLAYEVPTVVAEALGQFVDMAAYNGDDSWVLPLAATYVIDRDGTIVYAFIEADYKRRAEPADILKALASLRPAT